MSGSSYLLPILMSGLAMVFGGTLVNASDTTDADAKALRMALDDEYRAEATYAAVIETFGEVRPFIRIIDAERRHAARVKAEMDRLGTVDLGILAETTPVVFRGELWLMECPSPQEDVDPTPAEKLPLTPTRTTEALEKFHPVRSCPADLEQLRR